MLIPGFQGQTTHHCIPSPKRAGINSLPASFFCSHSFLQHKIEKDYCTNMIHLLSRPAHCKGGRRGRAWCFGEFGSTIGHPLHSNHHHVYTFPSPRVAPGLGKKYRTEAQARGSSMVYNIFHKLIYLSEAITPHSKKECPLHFLAKTPTVVAADREKQLPY